MRSCPLVESKPVMESAPEALHVMLLSAAPDIVSVSTVG